MCTSVQARNRRGTIIEIRKLSVMNHVRGGVGTYSLLSVYTSVVYAKGEVFLATKSNTVGLGVPVVFPNNEDRLLLFSAELHREIAIRETSGMLQATRPEGAVR